MSDKDVLADAKEMFTLCNEREDENRKDALDDLRFARLSEQWPDAIRKQRERDGRPCLTNNKLPAIIRQVINDIRQNAPSIKVHPADGDADPKTAEIYNGLIRNIEQTSRADVAYDTAADFAVTMGFGYFRVNTDYADDDSFDLDLVIKRIANPFSVWGDPYSSESDSSDWDTAFVTEQITKGQFKARYKGAEEVDWDALGYEGLEAPWLDDNRITIAEYFSRERVAKTILKLSNGEIVDEGVYKKNKDGSLANLTVIGTRKTQGHKVTQRIMTGAEVLETNPWAGKYIPIIPVYGDEVNVEGKRYFRSLIRDAKDPQRMFNFWRTASTELVALAPKAPFIGPKNAFATDASKWATANTESHAYIEYDGNVPPQRQPFSGVPAGALQEAMNASDDIKAITGLYDASLGARSNETSGKAILERKKEGDVSTFHFADNLNRAVEHCGRILVDLIPKVYTEGRIVRVLGLDGSVATVPIGVPAVPAQMPQQGQQPGNPGPIAQHVPVSSLPIQQQQDPQVQQMARVFALDAGKYDLTVETGPSYTTKREEAASQMVDLIQAYPQAAPVIGDLLVKNLDWPGADEIAQRLRALVPPQALGQGGQPAVPPEVSNVIEQGKQAIGSLQQQNAALAQELQSAQQDQANASRKNDIDEYKARTDRLEALVKTAAHNRQILGEAALMQAGINPNGPN